MTANPLVDATSEEYRLTVFFSGLYSGIKSMEASFPDMVPEGYAEEFMARATADPLNRQTVLDLIERAKDGPVKGGVVAEGHLDLGECGGNDPLTDVLDVEGVDGHTVESAPGITATGKSGLIALKVERFDNDEAEQINAEARAVRSILDSLIEATGGE